jgi:hypothetical protein
VVIRFFYGFVKQINRKVSLERTYRDLESIT